MSGSITALATAAARARIERALAFTASLDRGSEALLLGPTRAAIDELAFEHARRRGPSFGLHRKTLAGLAAEIAAPILAERGKALAPRLAVEAVAREVTYRLLARGALASFARRAGDRSAADGPSFPLAVLATVEELRLAGLSPAEVAVRSVDLGALLEAFSAELDARRLADRAEVLAVAAGAAPASPWAAMPIVSLDTPLWSVLDRRFFGALVSKAPEAVVLAPRADRDTLGHLTALGLEVAVQAGDDGAPPGLAALRARLFADDATEPPAPDDAVQLFTAPGEALEAMEIARAILADASRGVRFDEIAVAVRTREAYAPHLEAALARAGIPAYFEGGSRRPYPAGRALLTLIACKLERGSGRRLLEYLSTGQLCAAPPPGPHAAGETGPRVVDEALGRFGAPAADTPDERTLDEDAPDPAAVAMPSIRRFERILGDAGVRAAGEDGSVRGYVQRRLASSRALLMETIDAWRDEPDAAERQRAERDVTAIDGLAGALDPVLAALDAVPSRGTWRAILDGVRALAARAVRKPQLIYSVLAELEPLAASTEDADLASARLVLERRLGTIERPAPRWPHGRVLVTTTEGLRGRARRCVFVPGLAERAFPERLHEDPLLLDGAREDLGAGLATQERRSGRERLLFELSVGAATERLRLSYPRVEVETGRPRVPSIYAIEALRARGGDVLDLDALETAARSPSGARLEWPAPADPATAVDALELDHSFLAELLRDRERARGRGRILIAGHPHVHRALRARWRRYHNASFSENDGLYARTDAVRELVARRRPIDAANAVSPSALQAYAACPYRFYLQSVARIPPSPESAAIERLDAALYGELYHTVRADIFRRTAERGPAQSEADVETVAREVVAARAAEARARLDPLLGRVFDREVRALERDVLGALGAERARGDGFHAVFAELGFGVKRARLDPRSVADPARLPGGYFLRGAIDRVERSADGRVRVTDFKTGRVPEDIRGYVAIHGGRLLQPLLYALALEVMAARLLAPADKVAHARLSYATERGGFADVDVQVTADNKQRVMSVLAAADAALADGLLLALPRERACTTCPYQIVCGPDEERRAARKVPKTDAERRAVADLLALREMP